MAAETDRPQTTADPNIAAAALLMESADYIAATLPGNIDPRAWRALLIYAPVEEVQHRLDRAQT